ncbi:MAG: hypothetical protein IJT70_03135 [Clostridia bacterium]|nr:hypothetical protein [Clostridia bacterium]
MKIKAIVKYIFFAAIITALCAFAASCASKEAGDADGKKSQDEIHEMLNSVTDEDKAEYRKTIERYVEYLAGDGEAVRDLFPPGYWDDTGKTEEEAVADSIEFCKEDLKKNKEIFGDDFSVTYAVKEEHNYIMIIDDIKESIERVSGISCDKLDKVCYLDLVFSASGSKSSKLYEKTFYAVRLDGKWYLANEMGSFN